MVQCFILYSDVMRLNFLVFHIFFKHFWGVEIRVPMSKLRAYSILVCYHLPLPTKSCT